MSERGIIFGEGFLGTRIGEELGYEQIGREVNPLNTSILDDFLDREKPSVVLNAIAKTGGPGAVGIDWCEFHREESVRANVVVPINLATACSKRGIYFVHLGSGCIYEGDDRGRGFTEYDPPNFYGPQFYAKTKILAEVVLKEFPGLILRIRMPIDDRPHPRNLIDKLKMHQNVIEVPNSMTTIPHAIDAIKILIEKRRQGVYNLVNPGRISSAEIMNLYQRIVDPSHTFGIMPLEELNRITKGKRSNCYLNTDKLGAEGINLPEIHDAVEECLIKYKENLK